jgi:hypothetical protein
LNIFLLEITLRLKQSEQTEKHIRAAITCERILRKMEKHKIIFIEGPFGWCFEECQLI